MQSSRALVFRSLAAHRFLATKPAPRRRLTADPSHEHAMALAKLQLEKQKAVGSTIVSCVFIMSVCGTIVASNYVADKYDPFWNRSKDEE